MVEKSRRLLDRRQYTSKFGSRPDDIYDVGHRRFEASLFARDLIAVAKWSSPAARSMATRHRRDFDRQCGRNPVPDMREDALPTLAIDAGIVEPALGRPALR